MPEIQLIDDFIVVGAFCGILIGSTLLLKNSKTDANLPLGILMIFLGLSLLFSMAKWRVQGVNIIFLSILLIPLLSGSYLQILQGTLYKIPRTNSIVKAVFIYLLVHMMVFDTNWKVYGLIAISLGLGVCYLAMQYRDLSYRFRKTFKGKVVDHLTNWLLAFNIMLLAHYSSLVLALFHDEILVSTYIVQGGVSILLIGWTISLMLMPRHLYKTNNYLQVNLNFAQKSIQGASTLEKKSVRYTLKDHIKKEYVRKISSYMESAKPFLRKNFTLNKLTQDLELSPTYTSRVINEVYGKNFKDYVNGFRIENACKNLLNEKMRNYTIEAIAQESGFHSRTAFYNAFKRIMHMSPGEYISRNRKKVTA